MYGETSLGKEQGLQEHAMLDPTNPYSAAKAGAEMMCKAYQTRCALPLLRAQQAPASTTRRAQRLLCGMPASNLELPSQSA